MSETGGLDFRRVEAAEEGGIAKAVVDSDKNLATRITFAPFQCRGELERVRSMHIVSVY